MPVWSTPPQGNTNHSNPEEKKNLREEIAQQRKLIAIHQQNKREYELRAAKFGELHAPPYVLREISDLERV